MSSLQLSGCRASDISSTPLVFGAASSSFWSRCSSLSNGIVISTLRPKQKVRFCGGGVLLRVYAVSSDSCSSFKMNLNEYMVTLDKPLGIRFALSVDGKISVHSLKKGVWSSSLLIFPFLWFFFFILIIFLYLCI